MTTIYSPSPYKYPSTDIVFDVTNEVHTAEIEKARRLLAQAIEAKGEDYVYPKLRDDTSVEYCLYLEYEKITFDEEGGISNYVGPTGPSCIVGHVLVYDGVPYPKITEHEGENAGVAAKDAFTSTIVIGALNRAQSKQDHPNGYTWGEAVEEFEAFINERAVKTNA